MKTCSRCKEVKHGNEFGTDATRRDGLSYWCRQCAKQYRAVYNVKARTRSTETARAWRTANPEAAYAAERRWREANPEKVRAKGRRRYARVRANDPERLRRAGSDRQQRRRARLARVAVEQVDRAKVFQRDAWVCQLCASPVDPDLGWPHAMSASLDHRLSLALGGEHSYDNLQLAHLVCNQIKGVGAA